MVIPGSNHGTREVYEEKTVIHGCEEFAEVKAIEKKAMGNFCKAIRTDGRVVAGSGSRDRELRDVVR